MEYFCISYLWSAAGCFCYLGTTVIPSTHAFTSPSGTVHSMHTRIQYKYLVECSRTTCYWTESLATDKSSIEEDLLRHSSNFEMVRIKWYKYKHFQYIVLVL
jgi:hypothetical protein